MTERRISKAVLDPSFQLNRREKPVRVAATELRVTMTVLEDAIALDELIHKEFSEQRKPWEVCSDVQHRPPTHMVIVGEHLHVCPSCGHEQRIEGRGPVR